MLDASVDVQRAILESVKRLYKIARTFFEGALFANYTHNVYSLILSCRWKKKTIESMTERKTAEIQVWLHYECSYKSSCSCLKSLLLTNCRNDITVDKNRCHILLQQIKLLCFMIMVHWRGLRVRLSPVICALSSGPIWEVTDLIASPLLGSL